MGSLADPAQETRAVGAVDQAMVAGKRKWQHKTLPKAPPQRGTYGCGEGARQFAVDVMRFPLRARHAEDRDLGPVDDGGKLRPADPAEVGDRHGPALEFIQGDLFLPRALGGSVEFIRELKDGLALDVADDRHDQPAVGINGDTDVAIFLVNDLLGRHVDGGVKFGKCFQRRGEDFQEKWRYGQFTVWRGRSE